MSVKRNTRLALFENLTGQAVLAFRRKEIQETKEILEMLLDFLEKLEFNEGGKKG